MVNGKIDEAWMRNARLKAGGILKILDNKADPLTSRVKRHSFLTT